MASALTLVVLAAGIGSRYGGMKQLAEVGSGGYALMDYAIYDALEAGFDNVVFVVSERSHQAVKAHVEAGCGRRVAVGFACQPSGERRKPWGTGHAVLSARPFVDGTFAVVNADDSYGRQSFTLLGEGLSHQNDEHLLVGYTLRATLSAFGGVSRGVCLLDGDHLTSVVELHDVRAVGHGATSREPGWRALSGDEVVSTNLWGFRPTFFEALDQAFCAFMDGSGADGDAEFLIGMAVNSAIEGGGPSVRVLHTPDQFFGITFPEDLPGVRRQISARIAQGQYPRRLWGER